GYNFGAKLYQRLYDVIAYAKKLMVIYFVSAHVFSLIFAKQLFLLFSKEQNPIFMTDGPMALRIVSIGFLLIGFQVILSSVYQAMGYPVRAFLVAMSRQFILFLPLVFLFTYLWGINGVWYTFVTADLIAGLLSYIVFKYEMRDLASKIPANINLA
ncbi:MAG: MATE family efflux transporter, partial [Candidatus Izemoplasmatales bacterium]|nr:MATE family efflux transporter [Candidatus Izemoplasmatales bacterium]